MQNLDVENRLYQLESQIAELKSLILQKASKLTLIKKKKVAGEIQTRVVASTGTPS
jgi:hypothetical protein